MPTAAHLGGLGPTALSPQAQALYVALAHGHPCPEGQEEFLQELLGYGLVLAHPHPPGPGEYYLVRDPREVASERRELIYHQVGNAMAAAATLPEVLRPLTMAYQRVAPQLTQGAVEYVEGMETVNARLSQIVATATEEIQAAQPTGPRSQETLDMAIPRDLAAIGRGVAMRTIYRAECRSHEPTAGYVRKITTAGANVRTLGEGFLRAIIVDRRIAVLADHTPLLPGRDERRALILHDLGVVLYAAAMFDRDWERATPWRGEVAPEAGADVTERQRSIMQQIVAGAPQASIATTLKVSDRTVNAELAELRRLSGSNSLGQLGYWWAQQEAGRA